MVNIPHLFIDSHSLVCHQWQDPATLPPAGAVEAVDEARIAAGEVEKLKLSHSTASLRRNVHPSFMYPLKLVLSGTAFVEETEACEYTNTSEAKPGL